MEDGPMKLMLQRETPMQNNPWDELGSFKSIAHPLPPPMGSEVKLKPKICIKEGQKPSWLNDDVFNAYNEGLLLKIAAEPEFYTNYVEPNVFLKEMLSDYLKARTKCFIEYWSKKV